MNRRQITEELWVWTAPHPDWNGAPDWPKDVGCVYYEAPEAIVLIDPLVPRDEEAEFWAWLDDSVARTQLPVAVLLTAPWHQRSAAVVAARYGTVVWAHDRALSRLGFPAEFSSLPTGVEAFVPGGDIEGQVAFFLPQARAVVVAEFLMGADGGLRLCQSPSTRDITAFKESLRGLLDLPIDHVLVAHGDPVLYEGRKRIAEVLHVHA